MLCLCCQQAESNLSLFPEQNKYIQSKNKEELTGDL